MTRAVIDIGGTSTRYSVFDDGELVFTPESFATQDPERQIEELTESLVERYDFGEIGIATTGTASGDSIERMNVNGEEKEDIQPEIEGVDFLFENDTNAAALGENFHGAGRSYEDVLYITLSTGISSGLVKNDDVIKGSGNFGKTGHYVLEGENTWEELCSGPAIPETFNDYSEDSYDVVNAEEVFTLAENGDTEAERYLQEFLGKLNAKGVANACLSYDLEVVVLGGSVAVENPRVADDISEHFDSFYPQNYETPDIKVADLGHNSELYGAGELSRK